jgi:tyrosine-protein kinase Etk/Wzc
MDKSFSLLSLSVIFLRRKRVILRHFVAVTLIAVAVSLIIPKTYKATTLFLPPQNESNGLQGLSLSMTLNIGRESAFTPQQIETLLESRRILDATIARFDLTHVYKTAKLPNKNEQAIKKLRKKAKLTLATESGLGQRMVVHYSLSVVDKDPRRAADIANFMVDELGRAMDGLSRSQFRYSEQFIRNRLDSVVAQKTMVQDTLAAFQKKYKVYSPELKDQVTASIETYAELRKQKIIAEMERDMLLFDHSRKSREVRFAQQKVDEISATMDGIERGRKPDVLPSLDYSVDIAYRYLTLVQEAEVLTKLELMLRQQYEEARIRAARAAPSVRVVDRATPPEWKNFPKKAYIVVGIVGIYMMGLFVYILAGYGLAHASEDTKDRLRQFREALKFREG